MLTEKIVLSLSLFLYSLLAVAQNKTITGKVTSADNSPLAGSKSG